MTFADVRSAADVEALAARILEPREKPLVLVSTNADGHFRFDLDRLRNELDGAADIVTIKTGPASHDLERLLPPKTHTFGGATRVYLPDFGTSPNRTHLYFAARSGVDDIIEDVLGRSGASVASPPAPGDLATRHDVNALSREIAALRDDVGGLTRLVAGGERAPGASDLAQLRTEIELLVAENEQLRASLKAEQEERALTEDSQDQRDERQALRDARRAAERAHVDATADGIRIEIERTWSNRTSPGEHARWPLREFSFGSDFIDSLDALDEIQLSKAVRACVDAITGRDREIPARERQPLPSGEGGADQYVVRTNGARCWRSSIEQDGPDARRLHYWELADGVIELSRVVHQEDTRP